MRQKYRNAKACLGLALAALMALTACSGPASKSPQTGGGTPSDPARVDGQQPSSQPPGAADGEMTEVGTPRRETLIVEPSTGTDSPGQFNPYMTGTAVNFGMHQLLYAHLWEIDTTKGEQFGEVAEGMPEANADFTEHIVKIRKGIKWSDGEDLNADDVVFTVNLIMTDDDISSKAYYNTIFDRVEKVDDYTVKFVTKESFPRLAQKFGVTTWGNDLRIVPEHIYSKEERVTAFKDEKPVVAGPYTVKAYDPLGKWILYERRPDWQQSTVGVITGKEPKAKYVWFRFFNDDTTRQMAMINNEMDVLREVTPEMFQGIKEANSAVSAWYKEFPYATSDDPGAKGLCFMCDKAPFSNPDFRWGIALAMNLDEMTMNIFDGAGRASVLPVLTATKAMQEMYYKPLLPWLESLELDLGDGSKIKPWDPHFAERMGEKLRAQYPDLPTEPERLVDMFGVGCWKYDPEAAEKLLLKAGLEKKADGWYFEGKPFVIHMTYLADTEVQIARSVKAAYDQLSKFGLHCEIASDSTASWDINYVTGNFELSGYHPVGGSTRDIYTVIAAWDEDLMAPVGEKGAGQGARWRNAEATAIIHKLAGIDPASDEAYQLGQDFMKLAIRNLPFIGFLSGVKFVPVNETYWTHFPSAEDPYNGPWWWWSCFKYILPEIQPQS